MSLLPKSIHRCRRYPTKFNSGRDIPPYEAVSTLGPYVEDDPDLLRRAAGDGPEAESGLERYLAERASP